MKPKFINTVALMFTCFIALGTPPVEEGKAIFNSRCAGCHNINKKLMGPALAGVQERRSINWIISFVQSSQSLVKSGDKDAVALFNEFNKIPMPDHADLSADDVKNVVEFIKSESKTSLAEKAPFERPGKIRPNYTPLSITKDYGVFIGFFAVVFLLIVAMLFAVQLKEYERSKVW
ncbi:MAG TPA: cytochrome c [Chitinophagaceae bacterium]|nr:cytochrome c [Chitinophagaceae bacterium]